MAEAGIARDSASVVVVGAGIAGMACARRLNDAGMDVVVVERGRGPGGRMSTRRANLGDQTAHFDHGAPAFSANDPRFVSAVHGWIRAGCCAQWPPRREVRQPGSGAREASMDRFVGLPGMNAICGLLASGIDCRWVHEATRIEEASPGWQVQMDTPTGQVRAGCRMLVLAAPIPQLLRMELPHRVMAALPEPPAYETVWAVMIVLNTPVPPVPDWIETPEHPVLARVVRDSAKPGRKQLDGCSAWVAHAHPDWSRERRDASAEVVISDLVDALQEIVSRLQEPGSSRSEVRFARAHRWGLARATNELGDPCFWDPQLRLGICSDGFGGVGVEAAYISGIELADRLLDDPRQGSQPSP